MRLGVLTPGGECPGLNAGIRSVAHRAVVDHGDAVIGSSQLQPAHLVDGWHAVEARTAASSA